MKNMLSRVSGILAILFCLTITIAHAQSQDVKIGVGLAYGSGVLEDSDLNNDLGIRADGIYTFNENFRGGADFTFYFPKDESGTKFTVWEANFNVNYLFVAEDGINLYGLGGLNITFMVVDIDGFGSNSDSEAGLNLGGGVEFDLSFADLFGEIKYVISDADQLGIGAGLRFDI